MLRVILPVSRSQTLVEDSADQSVLITHTTKIDDVRRVAIERSKFFAAFGIPREHAVIEPPRNHRQAFGPLNRYNVIAVVIELCQKLACCPGKQFKDPVLGRVPTADGDAFVVG